MPRLAVIFSLAIMWIEGDQRAVDDGSHGPRLAATRVLDLDDAAKLQNAHAKSYAILSTCTMPFYQFVPSGLDAIVPHRQQVQVVGL